MIPDSTTYGQYRHESPNEMNQNLKFPTVQKNSTSQQKKITIGEQ